MRRPPRAVDCHHSKFKHLLRSWYVAGDRRDLCIPAVRVQLSVAPPRTVGRHLGLTDGNAVTCARSVLCEQKERRRLGLRRPFRERFRDCLGPVRRRVVDSSSGEYFRGGIGDEV